SSSSPPSSHPPFPTVPSPPSSPPLPTTTTLTDATIITNNKSKSKPNNKHKTKLNQIKLSNKTNIFLPIHGRHFLSKTHKN
ncbi:hypothetical protein Tsubulata_039022, partial [Turnera subulata]